MNIPQIHINSNDIDTCDTNDESNTSGSSQCLFRTNKHIEWDTITIESNATSIQSKSSCSSLSMTIPIPVDQHDKTSPSSSPLRSILRKTESKTESETETETETVNCTSTTPPPSSPPPKSNRMSMFFFRLHNLQREQENKRKKSVQQQQQRQRQRRGAKVFRSDSDTTGHLTLAPSRLFEKTPIKPSDSLDEIALQIPRYSLLQFFNGFLFR